MIRKVRCCGHMFVQIETADEQIPFKLTLGLGPHSMFTRLSFGEVRQTAAKLYRLADLIVWAARLRHVFWGNPISYQSKRLILFKEGKDRIQLEIQESASSFHVLLTQKMARRLGMVLNHTMFAMETGVLRAGA